MTREDAEQHARELALTDGFDADPGEMTDALHLLELLPDRAIDALRPGGIRLAVGRGGDGSIALEWMARPEGYGFRLLRFQSHGHGGFHVTLDQYLLGGPAFDRLAFPWENPGRPGKLRVGAPNAPALALLLFDWFFS